MPQVQERARLWARQGDRAPVSGLGANQIMRFLQGMAELEMAMRIARTARQNFFV
ncbi:hypothetical protein D3C80_1692220 [compost metagenome]